jgi:hypothetical protein
MTRRRIVSRLAAAERLDRRASLAMTRGVRERHIREAD